MYGSDINKILNGLYAGGTALAGGLIDKADRNKAKDTYEKESEYLKNTWAGSMEAANNILNPTQTPPPTPPQQGGENSYNNNSHTDIDGKLTNEVTAPTGLITSPQPSPQGRETLSVQPVQPNINDLYARREKAIMDLQGMKYGAPYAASLDRLYKNTLDPEVKNDWEIREGEKGEFFAINKETFEVKNITAPKPKEKEFSTKNWEVFIDDNGKPYLGERTEKGIEYRDELNKAELDDWNYKQEKKAKDLAPPVRTGSRGGYKTPKVKTTPAPYADQKLESKIKAYGDLKLADWNLLTFKQQDEYQTLKNEIANLTGSDADEVTNRYIYSDDPKGELEGIKDVKLQETEIMKNIDDIMSQFLSGEYDKQSLADSAYEWLGSLYSENIDPGVLERVYKIFNDFISYQFGGSGAE